jgi:dolichol-phosphate mannosyltransferase
MTDTAKAFTLIIPTYNERENIIPLLELVQRCLTGIDYEILVVDDDSPDGTADLAAEYVRAHPEVKVVRRKSGQKGLSLSVVDGFDRAAGRALGVMDADLSHDPEILPRLVNAVNGAAEAAVGSRRVPGGGADNWPWFRRLYSTVATEITRRLLNVPVRDPMSGYFVIRRAVYERAKNKLNATGYKILLELLVRAQVKDVVEIPFTFRDRKQGYSKLSSRVAAQFFETLWGLRSHITGVVWARRLFGRPPP